MSQVAIILTEAEFNRRIEEAVDRRVSALSRAMSAERDLPVRMSCKEAASHLNISESTFHRKFSRLKRYEDEGRTVFVLAKDLK